MRIVLDTGALWKPRALRALAELPDPVIVPAVVFTERARQVRRDGRPVEELVEALEANEFQVEPHGPDVARRYAVRIADDREWRRLARDAMIAGHVGPGDLLWTTNPGDFQAVGLAEEQILDVSAP